MNEIKVQDVNPSKVMFGSPVQSDITNPITDQCFDVYVGEHNVYHKDKNIQNCWIDYNLATISDKILTFSIPENTLLPDVIDLDEHIIPTINSEKYIIKWGGCNNQNILNKVLKYFKEHSIISVTSTQSNESPYTTEDNSIQPSGWFTEIPLAIDNLHINFDGNFEYGSFQQMFINTTINKLTMQFKQDNLKWSILSKMFSWTSIKEIEILDKNGDIAQNVEKYFLGAYDVTNMLEHARNIKIFPPIINWSYRQDVNGVRYTLTAYMCSNNTAIEEIQETTSNSREADINTIYLNEFSAQMFENCSSLKRIGPRLHMSLVRPGSNTTGSGAYRMFKQCNQLEDVLIYRLNAGTWRFDNNDYAGYLPHLNQNSMNYLFNNLLDLTKYSESLATDSVNTSWVNSAWTYNWTYTNNNNNSKTLDNIQVIMRLPSTWPDLFVYTTQTISNMKIQISGLQEQDILILPDSTQVTQDGIYTINTTGGTQVGFKLINTGITNNQYYSGSPVTLYIIDAYSPSSPCDDHGSIYFPEQDQCTITSEMVEQARQKGWTIYINNIEQ